MRRVKKACVSSSAIPSWWSTQPSRVRLRLKMSSPMAGDSNATTASRPRRASRQRARGTRAPGPELTPNETRRKTPGPNSRPVGTATRAQNQERTDLPRSVQLGLAANEAGRTARGCIKPPFRAAAKAATGTNCRPVARRPGSGAGDVEVGNLVVHRAGAVGDGQPTVRHGDHGRSLDPVLARGRRAGHRQLTFDSEPVGAVDGSRVAGDQMHQVPAAG